MVFRCDLKCDEEILQAFSCVLVRRVNPHVLTGDKPVPQRSLNGGWRFCRSLLVGLWGTEFWFNGDWKIYVPFTEVNNTAAGGRSSLTHLHHDTEPLFQRHVSFLDFMQISTKYKKPTMDKPHPQWHQHPVSVNAGIYDPHPDPDHAVVLKRQWSRRDCGFIHFFLPEPSDLFSFPPAAPQRAREAPPGLQETFHWIFSLCLII